jgi:hypothetical protein
LGQVQVIAFEDPGRKLGVGRVDGRGAILSTLLNSAVTARILPSAGGLLKKVRL